jgi:hypothetical protein
MTSPLNPAGPAQYELLIHFTGRPPGTRPNQEVPEWLRALTPEQRLDGILWDQRIYGFVPFGATAPHAMVCLSESPLEHLAWLINERQWPPWGLFVWRQRIFNAGGGPVWYARPPQHATLTPEQRAWAVRFESSPGGRSDWVHEQEWRVPVPPHDPALHLAPGDVHAVLVPNPFWQPTLRPVLPPVPPPLPLPGSSQAGMPAYVTNPSFIQPPQPVPVLPALWSGVQRWYWDWSASPPGFRALSG